MDLSEIDEALSSALTGRRLLDHPFYRRWEAGTVSTSELAAYAGQYRHFEAFLPGFLTRLVAALPGGPGRDLVASNLADEQGDPVAHVELFESFAAAVGAGRNPISAATSRLLSTYDELLDNSATSGLAGFVAYESQAAEIAGSKAEGLRRHYRLDDDGVRFWEHHARVDLEHGAWARDALAEAGVTGDAAGADLRRAADAWWEFLDERELLAGV